MAKPRESSPASDFLARADRPLLLYVIEQRDYSGAELMHLPILRADRDPLVACPPNSRTEELAGHLGVPTVAFPFRPLRHSAGPREAVRSVFRGLARARSLRRILRARPDRRILYCVALRPGMLAGVARLGLQRRTVWFVDGWMPPGPLRPLTRALAHVGCDRAIATSDSVASDFTGRSRRLRDRTMTLYPSTELDRFDPDRSIPGQPRATVLGHISPTKATDFAIDIAERVVAEQPTFELEVVGRAQYRASDFELEHALRERVGRDARLRDRVIFTGYSTDVADALSRSGLLLHCRPDEPFGIVLVEAMAMGLPVVAPAAAGPAEIVEHGVTGLLYRPGDADQAAAHIIHLVTNPAESARMGAAARAAAERRFSSTNYRAVLERVLEGVAVRAAELSDGPGACERPG